MACAEWIWTKGPNPFVTLGRILTDSFPRPLRENLNDLDWGYANGNGRNLGGKILEAVRRELMQTPTTPRQATILPKALAIGDSLLKGTGTKILEARIVSTGGANRVFVTSVAEMLSRPYVQQLLILAGTNDLVTRDGILHPASKIAHNLVKWATEYAGTNRHQTIVLCTLLPRPCNLHTRTDTSIGIFRDRLHLARTTPGLLPPNVQILDLNPLFYDEKHFADDGLHLSAAGTDQLAPLVRHAFRYNQGLDSIQQPF